MELLGNLLIFFLSVIFTIISFAVYSYFVYPLLQRTYYRGEVNDRGSLKKDIIYLGSRLLGWLVLSFIWWLYVYLLGYILVTFKLPDSISISAIVYGMAFLILMVATSWPRQIGSRILGKEWVHN